MLQTCNPALPGSGSQRHGSGRGSQGSLTAGAMKVGFLERACRTWEASSWTLRVAWSGRKMGRVAKLWREAIRSLFQGSEIGYCLPSSNGITVVAQAWRMLPERSNTRTLNRAWDQDGQRWLRTSEKKTTGCCPSPSPAYGACSAAASEARDETVGLAGTQAGCTARKAMG